MDLEKLKFPVGKYTPNKEPEESTLAEWIADIEKFPSEVMELTKNTTQEALQWKYRPDGWSVKQVIHHCADSHMNSLIRFKLALTEDSPVIRPYFEDRWAKLPDSLTDDVNESLTLLVGLHQKWTRLLRSLSEEDLKREFVHPEHGQRFNLAETIGNYAWHCNHHLAHIKNAIGSEGRYN